MTQSASDFDRALESYDRSTLGRQYYFHCPRCHRGISNPNLLQRPHWREDGPRVCTSCRSWEQKWERIEEGRRDRDEHLRGIK